MGVHHHFDNLLKLLYVLISFNWKPILDQSSNGWLFFLAIHSYQHISRIIDLTFHVQVKSFEKWSPKQICTISILSHFFKNCRFPPIEWIPLFSTWCYIHIRILGMWKRRNTPLSHFPQNSHMSITHVECAKGSSILSIIFTIFTQSHHKTFSTESFHHFHSPHIIHSIHELEWHDLGPFLHSTLSLFSPCYNVWSTTQWN